jgi:hypothetical protein
MFAAGLSLGNHIGFDAQSDPLSLHTALNLYSVRRSRLKLIWNRVVNNV